MFKKCAFITLFLISSVAFADTYQEETYETKCSVQATNLKTLKKLARHANFEAFGEFEKTYHLDNGYLMRLNEGVKSEKLLLFSVGSSTRILRNIAFAAKKGMNLIAFNDFCLGAIRSREIIPELEKIAGKTPESTESYVTLQFAEEE